ncbi:MAG: phytoene desaturase, partial [Candidatus Sericytochromatia bacterium]
MGQRPQVVVIGSGFGGLAAAIRLQARGFAVTLLEKRDQPGGRAYVYRDAGFAFDGGPTVVTAPFLIDELFALAGRRREDYLTFLPVDPYYRIRFDDGRTFHYNGDEAAMAEEVRRFSPKDVDGYRRFVEASRQIYQTGFEELADVPFTRARDMLRVVPAMVRLGSYRTVYGLVSRYIKDPDLRVIMSFHPLLVGGNPFSTTSIYSLIAYLERRWGVWFAQGGTGAIVDALVKLFTELGGTLRLGAEVAQIRVENGRAVGVECHDGSYHPAAIVVSNADAPFTYKHMIDPAHRKKHTDARVDRMDYSMGLVVAYFGTKRTYPDMAHHTILLSPRYKTLLEDIFRHKRLASDFSLYLHAPTRTDPSLAPEGCENFYVLAPVPNMASGIDWQARAEEYSQKIYEYLESTCLPGLQANMVTSRVITPHHFQTELNSLQGAGFSVQPVLQQSAYFRFHNRSEDIAGLYFVGAGTHPGAGMPGV